MSSEHHGTLEQFRRRARKILLRRLGAGSHHVAESEAQLLTMDLHQVREAEARGEPHAEELRPALVRLRDFERAAHELVHGDPTTRFLHSRRGRKFLRHLRDCTSCRECSGLSGGPLPCSD